MKFLILELKKMFENEDKIILRDTMLEKRGQGLKILTPNQMPSRLPISLAQLKAENNSEKLKSEIRQLLYSLYRSKKLTKTIYNNLISTIKNENNLYEHWK